MADEQKKEGEEDVSGHVHPSATGDERPSDAPGFVTSDKDEDEEDVSGHVHPSATGDDEGEDDVEGHLHI